MTSNFMLRRLLYNQNLAEVTTDVFKAMFSHKKECVWAGLAKHKYVREHIL